MEDKSKKIGVVTLTALVTGNMIGSGIFLLPSAMARLGSLSLVSWIFTTVGSLFLALVFSRMSRMIPKTGGPYAYAHAGLGKVLGFQTAYSYWVSVWVGNAAIALAGIGYLSVFFPALSDPLIASLSAIGFVWLFTLINLNGIKSAGTVQVVTTILKLLPIFFVAIFGWMFFNLENITSSANVSAAPHYNTFEIITAGATLTLWGFLGLESATVPAESVENPKKMIPIATIVGMLIAAAAYISSSVVIMGMVPNELLQKSVYPFADAAQMIIGDWGKWLVASGAAVSCLGCLNGWILIQGQIPMAAADDGMFIKIFGRRNKKGVPAYGLIITASLITLLMIFSLSPNLVEQFQLIILIAVFASLVPYLYTPVAEIILFMRGEHAFTKKAIAIAIMGILYSCWAVWGAGHEVLALGSLLLMSSIPLYLLNGKRV